MIFSDIVGIIADDLTGANDTALQFHKRGAKTKILLDSESVPKVKDGVEVWALSSESRNVDTEEAVSRVEKAVTTFAENFSFDYYYKKIDSTLRGHIAPETLTMLNILEYDASIIIPAFPQEERVTIGGYHIAKGMPIGRTEMAIDPHSPITESHVPTLLKMQLGEISSEIVGTIDLRTVMAGAGPILVKIGELIKEGKRLIVADAVSITDIEQIVLAITKSEYKLLPTGTAATAQVFSKYWLAGKDSSEDLNVKTGSLPKLIISGTATKITSNQIQKLEQSGSNETIKYVPLDTKTILNGVTEDFVSEIAGFFENHETVCVHTSNLVANFDGFSDDSLNADLTREKFAGMITDFLGEFTKEILEKINPILITLGGETSYKCCKAIDSNELQLVDEVCSAISLCSDVNNRWIITKSGNLGDINTLIDILNYLNHHE